MKTFFSPPPAPIANLDKFEYPNPLPDPPQINPTQIAQHIAKLLPYKACGPDAVPNIVLQKCSDLLIDRLTLIFRAIMENQIYYDQ